MLKILLIKSEEHFHNEYDDENNETDSVQFPDLNSINYTAEELAAAYLTVFFKGKLTQRALSATIELGNLISPINYQQVLMAFLIK